MSPNTTRSLTRVEREWVAFPFQPLDDLFTLAGTNSAADAEALGEGLAWAWSTWFFALSKPVRRRNARRLAEGFQLPDWLQAELVRELVEDDARAIKLLRNFMVGFVKNSWTRQHGDGPDDDAPSLDWDLWTGPGIG